jgi:hypothetical protein
MWQRERVRQEREDQERPHRRRRGAHRPHVVANRDGDRAEPERERHRVAARLRAVLDQRQRDAQHHGGDERAHLAAFLGARVGISSRLATHAPSPTVAIPARSDGRR